MVHNREEDLARPTLPPAPGATLLAGQDAERGGTWFGIDPASGRFAAITNIRHSGFPSVGKEEAVSRGELVRAWLAGEGCFPSAAASAPTPGRAALGGRFNGL
jgi:uncharacterized protein with NRDE domain